MSQRPRRKHTRRNLGWLRIVEHLRLAVLWRQNTAHELHEVRKDSPIEREMRHAAQ